MAKIRLRKFLSQDNRITFNQKGKDQGPAAGLKARLRSGKKLPKGSRRKFKIRDKDSPPWPELETQFIIPEGPRSSKWWDLFKDGINNSGVALWLTCKHQFYLRYVCGYDRYSYAEPIEFGNVFHWLIEQWHTRGKLKKPFQLLAEVYHPEWMKTAPLLSTKDKETQSSFYGLAAAMWPFYADRYAADLKQKKRVVEREFHTYHKLADGTRVPLYGTIDFEYRAGEKEVDIIDHKTSSFINEMEKQAALLLDFQLMFYSHARQRESQVIPHTIFHDVIRRTHLKKTAKETPQGYGKRIAAKIAENPAYFFIRFPCRVGSRKLKAYRDGIINPIMEDLAAWARGETPHYPNPNALVGRYGPCKFFTPITQGNFAGLERKRPTTRGVEIQ